MTQFGRRAFSNGAKVERDRGNFSWSWQSSCRASLIREGDDGSAFLHPRASSDLRRRNRNYPRFGSSQPSVSTLSRHPVTRSRLSANRESKTFHCRVLRLRIFFFLASESALNFEQIENRTRDASGQRAFLASSRHTRLSYTYNVLSYLSVRWTRGYVF